MNILYATRAAIPYPSAASINSMRMCESLAALGHDVTLAVGRKLWRRTVARDIWSYYGVAPTFRIERTWELPKVAGWFDRSVIGIARETDAILYARYPRILANAIGAGVNVLLEIHSRPSPGQLSILSRFASAREFLGLVVITRSLHQAITNAVPQLRDRVVVAPDAVNINSFVPSTRLVGPTRVGYVGSLHTGKGMEIIAPVSRLMPQTQFVVIGGRPKQVSYWRRETGSLSNLSLAGAAPPTQVPQRMHEFDIALLPNQPHVLLPSGDDIGQFTSPMKLFEYMAAGKAIVASDLPNLREVLQHESNCLLVPHDDHEAWAHAIDRLKTDEMLRQRISDQARTDAVERYSYKTRFQNILRFFQLSDVQRDAA